LFYNISAYMFAQARKHEPA